MTMELFNINNRVLLIISISSLLLSSYLLASSAHGDDGAGNPIPKFPGIVFPSIDKICWKTKYPALCTSTVVPFLNRRQPTPALALELEIKACLHSTQAALAVLKKTNCAITSPVLFKDLQENFESAVENLQVAAAAIAKHDVGTVKTRLSAVITDFSTCNDSLEKIEGGAFKVEDVAILHNLASNCLALSTLL